MARGSAPRCSTARAPSRASRPISICTARAINKSVKAMCLKPVVTASDWMALVRDGLKRFDRDAELYIRPMYWAEEGARAACSPDPESTRWCLTIYVAPMPKPAGTAITLSPFRRPTRESAPVEAKAGCLYPNNARALDRGAVRAASTIASCATCSAMSPNSAPPIFSWSKDGVVFTPAANGTYLAGITRQRHHQAVARLRRRGRRNYAALFRFQIGRRDFLFRQLHQGLADHPHRRASPRSRGRCTGGPASSIGSLRTRRPA